MNNARKYLSIFLLIVLAAFIFWSSVSLQMIFYESVLFFEDYVEQNEFLSVVIFVVLAALSAFLSPFSSAPLAPIAVMIWGNTATFIMLFAGWMLGDVAAYLIGRFAGRPIIKNFIDFDKVEYYLERIPARINFWLAMLFRFSVPSEIGGYVLGIIRYRFWRYFFVTFVAELPFAAMVVYASDAWVNQKTVLFLILISVMMALMAAALYFFNKKMRKKSV